MGRLIDCGEVYNAIQITTDNFGVAKHVVESNMYTMLSKIPTVNAIPIPEGATRADVFKIVFGYAPAKDSILCNVNDWCGENEACEYCISNPQQVGKDEDWWNAPYKRE